MSRAVLPFLGEAFIASVAYIDPGNFATNMAGGAQFGYALLWVVLGANLMAMLVQALSAKLGIATGRSLPEMCRDRLAPRLVVLACGSRPRRSRWRPTWPSSWGPHLGSARLRPVAVGLGAADGVAAVGILALQSRGFRWLEAAVAGLVARDRARPSPSRSCKSSPPVAGGDATA